MHRLSRHGNVPNVLGLTAMSVTWSRHACELPFLCDVHAVDVLLVDHSSSCLKDRDLRPVSNAQGLAGLNITQRSFLCHSGANTCLRYRPLVVATDWRAPGGKCAELTWACGQHGGLATAVGVTPDESAPTAFGNEMWFLFVTQ